MSKMMGLIDIEKDFTNQRTKSAINIIKGFAQLYIKFSGMAKTDICFALTETDKPEG